jgi:23S rRNA (adenine2030-N6)-methyltransferase
VAALLAPYLDVINAFNPAPPPEDMDASPGVLSQASAQPHATGLQAYPGSPLIARALLRPQDRMVACELEPQARKRLIAALYRDAQARVVDLDGWTALPAFVPPKERRGVVLIDPPFERPDEFEAMASGFNAAFAKWPTGVYVLWYPIKALRPAAQFGARVAAVVAQQPAGAGKSLPAGNPAARNLREKCLRVEFHRAATQPAEGGLGSAGLLIVNPPWMLAQELGVIMPALTAILGQDATARFRIDHPSP